MDVFIIEADVNASTQALYLLPQVKQASSWDYYRGERMVKEDDAITAVEKARGEEYLRGLSKAYDIVYEEGTFALFNLISELRRKALPSPDDGANFDKPTEG